MPEEKKENTEQKGLLKDAPPQAAPAIQHRPARRKRETEEQRALRDRQERIELLKMKQGLIEESEVIPESGYVEIPKPTGWAKVSNFFYHNKLWIIMIAFFAFVLGICIYQFATKEKYDIYVLAVSSQEKSEIGWRVKDIEAALEMYCSDYDGNGKVNVVVNFIDRSSFDMSSEYAMTQASRMSVELLYGEGQIIVSEEGLWDLMYADSDGDGSAFGLVDLTDQCDKSMLFKNCGIRINQTGFADSARWRECPDNICIYLRDPEYAAKGKPDKIKKINERAREVIRNILDGNIVNPPEES